MLHIAIEAAKEAGKFLKYSVGKVKSVEMKQGEERNLVSEIDKGSEAKIISIIKRHYPNHAILAEESGATASGGSSTSSDCKWVIDPRLFTHNYNVE